LNQELRLLKSEMIEHTTAIDPLPLVLICQFLAVAAICPGQRGFWQFRTPSPLLYPSQIGADLRGV
jgi:hypothetical protein